MNYDFSNIKAYVETVLKINTEKGKSTFEPIRERLTQKEVAEKVRFDSDGIFYVDENGKEFKGFLFIEIFDPVEWRAKGWNDVPRFHILNCNTIEKQKHRKNYDGHYVFSNQPVTDVLDADGKENDLLLCGNCYNVLNEKINPRTTTTEYCHTIIDKEESKPNFNQKDLPKSISLENYGYTPDWDEQSKQYRIKKRFTCENCGIKLNNSFSDGFYLETHHKNGNKQDNSDANLTCLCILCHSNVDRRHKANYSSGENKKKLNDFITLFRNQLFIVENPYLTSSLLPTNR